MAALIPFPFPSHSHYSTTLLLSLVNSISVMQSLQCGQNQLASKSREFMQQMDA